MKITDNASEVPVQFMTHSVCSMNGLKCILHHDVLPPAQGPSLGPGVRGITPGFTSSPETQSSEGLKSTAASCHCLHALHLDMPKPRIRGATHE